MTDRILDPTSEADRAEVRAALVQYVQQLSSEQIVDLLIELRREADK